ncbi:MAG TPA: ABC transporter substrate-binding protein [Burkholderiales bacterium]|nr:ABC transporter substrate-binding protein [Burkholderiales bacterium]
MNILFVVCMMFMMPLAIAQEIAPDVLIRGISEEVTAAIRQDKRLQAGDAGKIAELVEAKILPHFDFRRTTQIAMGANWRRATPEQQEQLVREFRTLLVRTYSGALGSYRDQVIEFRPLRAQPGDSEVTVRSQVKQPGAVPVAIEYDMERTGSAWKVFDVRVSGISLVATYRSAFAEEVRNHGIDGLISLLSSKNRGAVKPVSVKT